MATEFPELFEALMEEFHPDQVERRPDGGYPYVTTRTIMNRLDKVLGPENWWDDYVETPTGVICRMTIRVRNNSHGLGEMLVTKCGYGCNPPVAPFMAADRSKQFKEMSQYKLDADSAYADAFKRAAVKFTVSRYLYNEGLPSLTKTRDNTAVGQPNATSPITPQVPPASTPPQQETVNPKEFLINPQAKTSGVWTWILKVAKYYQIDCPKLIAELSHKNGISVNHEDWDQATVERICTYLRKRAAKTAVYKGEFEARPLPEPSAPAPAVPQVEPAIQGARDNVWRWAQWLATQRSLADGTPVTDPMIRGVIYTATEGKWNHPDRCSDINVLDAIANKIRTSSTTY